METQLWPENAAFSPHFTLPPLIAIATQGEKSVRENASRGNRKKREERALYCRPLLL
jgi:hypothetical protein